MQGSLATSVPAESKLRRRRRRLVYLLRVLWFGAAVMVVQVMLLTIRPAYIRYSTPCMAPPCADDLLTPAGLDALSAIGWTPHRYALYYISIVFLVAFFYFSTAILLYRARPDEPIALFSSIGLMLFGVFFTDYIEAARSLGPGMGVVVDTMPFISVVWFMQLFYLFPDGRYVPPWTRWATVGWIAAPLIVLPFSMYDPDIWGALVLFTVIAVLLFTCIVAPIYRYRNVSDPIERQQTKWVLFGLLQLLVLTILFGDILPFIWPILALNGAPLAMLNTFLQAVSMALMPITMAMAILRYRLWDVDRILNRTLVYIPLTSILTVIYGASLSFSQRMFTSVAGETSPAVAIFTTIILTTTFTPIKNTLQSLVDRSFKEPVDPLKQLKELEKRVFHVVDLLDQKTMARQIGEQVLYGSELKGVALYLRDGEQMRPVYVSPRWSVRSAVERLPLVWQGEVLGHLVLGAKRDNERFSADELAALQQTTTRIAFGLHRLTHLTPPGT